MTQGTPDPGPTPPNLPEPGVPLRIDDSHAIAVSNATAKAMSHARQFVGQNNVLAVPALVLSCLGVVTYICAPIGAILGHVARKQIQRRGQTGGGFALAAVIIGWTVTGLYTCGIVIPVLLILLKVTAISGLLS
ncbi:hypothetical protein Rhe02_04960 [Rhizocola hellebori]|uniref:DUF4190 domain-containing protein n=1 Tax=Rhizocola hellebori TaxID=1392758 RepID=A0A8J3Q2F4_9ACTN|nr:DUF4190 domain-containing protein [Rhizocola hellebori]GIH02429.1 hypothetical protein Rhe02_04960 [Rhizocola hellebori]